MMNMDIFQLFFNYLEERPYNNVYQNVKQDADYLGKHWLIQVFPDNVW